MYAMRSPAERAEMAAAMVSSQQERAKGEISPISVLSWLITAMEVWFKCERLIKGSVEMAGSS